MRKILLITNTQIAWLEKEGNATTELWHWNFGDTCHSNSWDWEEVMDGWLTRARALDTVIVQLTGHECATHICQIEDFFDRIPIFSVCERSVHLLLDVSVPLALPLHDAKVSVTHLDTSHREMVTFV